MLVVIYICRPFVDDDCLYRCHLHVAQKVIVIATALSRVRTYDRIEHASHQQMNLYFVKLVLLTIRNEAGQLERALQHAHYKALIVKACV